MDLFTVSCITCRAKLTVKQLSAIGQILPCPKCGGMVQIAPPKGWKPPATPPAAPATPTNMAARAPQAAAPQAPSPATPSDGAGEVYTAQLADDDPLARPRGAATPAERRARLAVYGVVATASTALVAYAAWSALKGPAETDVARIEFETGAAGPSPTTPGSAPARSEATPSGMVLRGSGAGGSGSSGTGLRSTVPAVATTATPSPSNPVPIATPPATGRPDVARPPGVPSSSAMLLVAAPSATAVSPPASMPSATAAASPAAAHPTATHPRGTPAPLTFPPVASATPSGPAASPAATGPFAMPPRATGRPFAGPIGTGPIGTGPPANGGPAGAAPPVDVTARLGITVPSLRFENTPLRRALAVAAELAGLPIRYDWSTLPLDFRIDEPVSLTVNDAKLGDVLDGLTRARGLRVAPGEGMLVVAGPDSAPDAPQAVDHPIDDLFGMEEAAADGAGKLVRAMVAPETWHAPGGGSAAAASGKLVISHLPRVQEEAALFLNRLRTARGKPPRSAENVPAIAPPAETRVSRVRTLLEGPVTMNFRPGAPLPAVADYLEEAAKCRIVVDYGTLSAAGYSVEEPVGISAQQNRLAEVLDALCRPRAWGWHMPRDGVIELTSLEAARGRTYVEFYDVRPLVEELTAEEFTARVIEATPELGWNDAGGRTAMGFDQPSGRLIVRQTIGGHLQLERLIAELTPRPAGGAPAASGPTPTAVPGPAGR